VLLAGACAKRFEWGCTLHSWICIVDWPAIGLSRSASCVAAPLNAVHRCEVCHGALRGVFHCSSSSSISSSGSNSNNMPADGCAWCVDLCVCVCVCVCRLVIQTKSHCTHYTELRTVISRKACRSSSSSCSNNNVCSLSGYLAVVTGAV
jgi:hypothetical protein